MSNSVVAYLVALSKRRKVIPSNQVTFVEKAVQPTQNTVLSHTPATIQQARGEVLFLPTRNHKAVKRPNPTEEEDYATLSQQCEQLQAIIVEPWATATKKFRLNMDDEITVMNNASKTRTQSNIMPGTSNLAAFEQYGISRSNDRIPFDYPSIALCAQALIVSMTHIQV
ncbi:hypothetical protein INT43_005059 [Umbelopsis isabellina]|uniref:Uncharacterized protein n=1 Tax=Mortierella isabellina TaxID=91625 RepID=A0A8H7PI26_MORIS|nr:hypothetical protein INT43_005059 [Umbelopsis isabellina]